MKFFLKYKIFLFFLIPLILISSQIHSNNFDTSNKISINNHSQIKKEGSEVVINNKDVLNSIDWNSILNSIESYLKIFENIDDQEILKERWKGIKNNDFLFLNNFEIIKLNKIFVDNSDFLNTKTFIDYKSSIDTNKLTKENSPLPLLTTDFKEKKFFIDMISRLFVQTRIPSSVYNFNNENSLAYSLNELFRGNPELVIFSETFENIYGSKATLKITDFEKPVPEGYYIYKFSEKFKENYAFIKDEKNNIISFEDRKTPGYISIFAPISLFLNEGIINDNNKSNFDNVNITLNKIIDHQKTIASVEKQLESDPLNSQNFLNSGNLILIIVLPITLISILIATILLIKKRVSSNSKKEKF